MEHAISYDLARGLHIIAAIAWIAGLLMLPRFYAYLTPSQPGGELEASMLKAAQSLRAIILGPSMVLAWAFLGETVTPMRMAGTLLIAAGIVVLART